MKTGKFFITDGFVHDPDFEFFETILSGNEFRLEKIISSGHQTPEGQWYDQEHEEWVILLQGKAVLEFENGEVIHLEQGDYVYIAAHERHRVLMTSHEPPCYWLALHGKFNSEDADNVQNT